MTEFLRRTAAALIVASLATPFALPAVVAPAAAQSGQPMLLPVDPDRLVAETASNGPSFSIEIADTDAERSAGLMFRRVMPDDRGMLFVFEETRRVAFWMKNTPMPLDLIFVGEDGAIVDIRQGVPFSEAAIAPQSPVRFVLEVKAGTAQKAGILAGDRLRHPVIDRIAGAD
ncbi:MAG: DUF192 domain-containing protein [Rhizobiaceae bacterium]|nr:DUF192 domain-containing protein [Rhizobiaceae bacterium]